MKDAGGCCVLTATKDLSTTCSYGMLTTYSVPGGLMMATLLRPMCALPAQLEHPLFMKATYIVQPKTVRGPMAHGSC